MRYHDNDLPSLRNINTHQQTWELHSYRGNLSQEIEISIQGPGPATEHGFFRRLRVTNDNPFIFLLRRPQTESLMVMSRHFYILTFLRVHHEASDTETRPVIKTRAVTRCSVAWLCDCNIVSLSSVQTSDWEITSEAESSGSGRGEEPYQMFIRIQSV